MEEPGLFNRLVVKVEIVDVRCKLAGDDRSDCIIGTVKPRDELIESSSELIPILSVPSEA